MQLRNLLPALLVLLPGVQAQQDADVQRLEEELSGLSDAVKTQSFFPECRCVSPNCLNPRSHTL